MMAPRNGKKTMKVTHAAFAHPERSSRRMTSPISTTKSQMAMTQKNMTIIHQKTSRNVVSATTISPPLPLGEARALYVVSTSARTADCGRAGARGSSPGDPVHPGEAPAGLRAESSHAYVPNHPGEKDRAGEGLWACALDDPCDEQSRCWEGSGDESVPPRARGGAHLARRHLRPGLDGQRLDPRRRARQGRLGGHEQSAAPERARARRTRGLHCRPGVLGLRGAGSARRSSPSGTQAARPADRRAT